MPNNLSEKHPEYSDQLNDWTLMRDSYKGERQVKSKFSLYLPYTSSQVIDGATKKLDSAGAQAYAAYKMRARFQNYLREAVQMAIGMMHSQPPEIKLPKAMEKIRSSKGESLPKLLRRINTEQLITGRLGLMADIPTDPVAGADLPYLTTYHSERIINWDDGNVDELVPQVLNLVVLDESENIRKDGFNWQLDEKYRVLQLGALEENETRGVYTQGVFEEQNYAKGGMTAPSWRGKTLESIPFVIINASDLVSDPDEPPLLALANLCMAIYRGDADYRQNLFMKGQDTLVISGGSTDEDDPVRTGAGARIDLPQGAKAEYIGVNSNGLSEQRESQEHMESIASSMGAQTMDTTSRERESGTSLRIRVAARTADMNQIVETGAEGMEQVLKDIAIWIGENPDDVSVKPNKEFGEMPLTGQDMVEMATARTLGWPLSAKSMHELSTKRRISTMTFEEEMAQQKLEDAEGHPFKKPDTADRAGADQNNAGGGTG